MSNINSSFGNRAATQVTFFPTADISAINVQEAIVEVNDKLSTSITGDADTLDGNHASAFATASHTHSESEITNLTTDLGTKAPLASPTFTGTPSAPTASAGTNTTQIATTAYVKAEITNQKASQTVYGSAKIYISGSDLYIYTT